MTKKRSKVIKIVVAILLGGGILSATYSFLLNKYFGNEQSTPPPANNSSVNFNEQTEVHNSNVSGGNITVYSTKKQEKTISEDSIPPRIKNKIPESEDDQPNFEKRPVQILNSNVAGRDVIIKSEDIKKLADYYEFQAEEIREQLAHLYCFVPIKEYLLQFEELHEKHISALKDQNLILAAKYLQKIHRLSSSLAFSEEQLEKEYREKYADSLGLMLSGVEYLREYQPKAIFGDLANKYLTGKFRQFSEHSSEWPLPERYSEHIDSRTHEKQFLEFYILQSKEILMVD